MLIPTRHPKAKTENKTMLTKLETMIETIKHIELDNKQQMEDLKGKYETQIKEQQSKIDDYEARLSELEKQLIIKK